MNLLKRQGFFNSLILYAGTALGFFNLVILFQRCLSIEQIGFFSLMIAISLIYAQFASVGIGNVILKYFPYYSTPDRKHNGFGRFILIYSGISFALFTIFFIAFKNPIIAHYSKEKGAGLLVKYYYYLIPISLLTMAYAIFESMARAIFKNVLSAFLKEVLLRVFTSVSILLIGAAWINYQDFLVIYLVANLVIVIILWYSIYKDKHFPLSPVSDHMRDNKVLLLKYGVFTVLSGTSFALIQNLDILMLSILRKESLEFVGIYSTFFNIAVVISLPAKAMNRTSLQIVSQAWSTNDLPKIDKIYYKTSVVQMLIGCLLFVGLIVNRDFIMVLLKKHEYVGYFDVFIIVGIGFLVDITGGLNGYIMNVSKHYKLTTYFITATVVFCVVLNWFLIPQFGMVGAAISYTLTMFILNFIYWLFVKIKFGLQPFGKAHLLVLLVSAAALVVGLYLPLVHNIWLDVILRSGIVAVVYVSLSYLLKISADINELFDSVLKFKKGN
jgi:O-antigen/teichoic acid export membrane protein